MLEFTMIEILAFGAMIPPLPPPPPRPRPQGHQESYDDYQAYVDALDREYVNRMADWELRMRRHRRASMTCILVWLIGWATCFILLGVLMASKQWGLM